MSPSSLAPRAAVVAASTLTATVVAAVVLLVVAPTVARAGDCPECTSAADCGRAGSFCVLHEGPSGAAIACSSAAPAKRAQSVRTGVRRASRRGRAR
ncbi:MAG: hypothetical protein IT379_07415 [Deltaproteobacteria bacterium]|nr:hypothetical protein [Deltaproteobacteria bacterium]